MAAFENKTISEIRDLIINSIKMQFNATFRILPKSFIRVISTVFAGIFVVLYKQIGWLFLQLFPETAYWGEVTILGKKVRPLIMWGRLIGVGEPKNGTQWKGFITVIATSKAGSLVAGTQLKSDINAKLYITDESVLLDNNMISVPIICAENGTAGNLDRGDVLSFVAPLGTVQKIATVSGVANYAIDDEIETIYRARVVSRFRNPPLGGALSDYRKWGSDVNGVYNIYPYKDTQTAAGVFLYVAGIQSLFPDRVPSPELLIQVGKTCTYDPETGKASRKPMTAVIDPLGDETYINVRPVSIVAFDVKIDGVVGVPVADFTKIVKPAIRNYFLGREPYIRGLSDDNNKTNIISRNNVSTVVDHAAISVKAEFESVVMFKDNVTMASYTLNVGELAKLRNLYINEVLA
jgi:uncharacterized phage protein gp47/JayE